METESAKSFRFTKKLVHRILFPHDPRGSVSFTPDVIDVVIGVVRGFDRGDLYLRALPFGHQPRLGRSAVLQAMQVRRVNLLKHESEFAYSRAP